MAAGCLLAAAVCAVHELKVVFDVPACCGRLYSAHIRDGERAIMTGTGEQSEHKRVQAIMTCTGQGGGV